MPETRRTPAQTPEECDELFAIYMNAGEPEPLIGLYEPGASLVRGDGRVATGTAAIRAVLNGSVAELTEITMNVTRTIRVGDDLAILYNDWSLRARGLKGAAVESSGRAIEVVRRQPDGRWLFALDDPFARGRGPA
jgi:uncharacterized protein (TIGR02246 family)